MQQSRDIVNRTLEFESPARIPRHLWVLPWAEEHHPAVLSRIRADYPDDIVNAPEYSPVPEHAEGDPYAEGISTDEWGCRFINIQRGVIGEVKEPLLAEWCDVDSVRPPEELLELDVDAVNRFCSDESRFIITPTLARPFERLQFIRTTERAYMDIMDRPHEFETLMARMHRFYTERFERWAATDVDGLFFMDDWGAQQSLLVPPALWRELFKPLYRDYIDIAHAHGKKAFMHSDGYIIDIIPDLIELGLDALNAQVFCMGVENLGERFAGGITFWGEIDRQHILPRGSSEDIDAAVASVAEHLYRDGGIIAQCEFGPGAAPENIYRVFEAWSLHGK